MIITKKAISRRTMLRGIGATLALPLLDAMVPPMTALAQTPARSTIRFGAVYIPNGVIPGLWVPPTEGVGFEFFRAEPAGNGIGLASMRERVEMLGGTFELASSPGKGTRIRVEVPQPKGDESNG